MKPEVFLADECVKEISQSRYKAKLFKDDEAIERARWKVRRMLVESFVDKELYGSKKDEKEEGEGKTKQTLLDFAKFARQLSICRSTALRGHGEEYLLRHGKNGNERNPHRRRHRESSEQTR